MWVAGARVRHLVWLAVQSAWYNFVARVTR